MADKTIGELDELLSLQDSSLIPVQQGGSAYHITGAKLKAYAESAASSAAEIAVEGTIEDAQAWATGMRGSASVSTSDPTYHNNSKYFYEQAQAQAAAATSAASTFTTDTTLSVSGKAADAAKTGQVKRDLWSYNVVNILTDYVGRTHNGITFSGDTESKTFTVTGTASSGAFCNIMGGSSIIPTGLSAGGIMCFRTSGLSESGVYIRLYLYPNTLPNRERIITSGTIVPIPDSCVGMLARLEVKSGTSVNQTVGVEITNALPAGDVIAAYCEKEIKILCFGSSFTYSTLGYLPHVLRDIDPHVHLVLGICYDSGQTLSGHSTKWDNDTPYTTYSEYDSWIGSWTSLSESVSGKDAVDRYKWDYICLQQASRYTNDYASLEGFADKISNYITYSFGFLYNLIQSLNAGATFPTKYNQSTGQEKSDAMFADMASYAERAQDDCIVFDVIPCGTAVQSARTSSLDTIATNAGDLAADNNGHLQNGLPVLIGAYTAAYKVCEIIGIKPKLFSSPFNPTDSFLTSINQPGSTHGSCIGVSDANKLIAQKCALMAIKHPFEISDMSGY